MAETKLTLKDAFEELFGFMKRGISELDHIGVSKDKAAELTEKLLMTANYAVGQANAPQGFPPGVPAGQTEEQTSDPPKTDAEAQHAGPTKTGDPANPHGKPARPAGAKAAGT